MFPAQTPPANSKELSPRSDTSPVAQGQDGHNENAKADVALAREVDHTLWKDTVFRAMEYGNIDARVNNGFVHLYGHVSSLNHRRYAESTLQTIPGLRGVNNDLIADDRLTTEVAMALAPFEHDYDCKFFTGVSHGLVSLNGNVGDEQVRLLAEKCAASNPNVRGVMNNIRVQGNKLDMQDAPFLQPLIGEEISFLDGISGRVSQVVINPDNRRVVAMILYGHFRDRGQELQSLNAAEARPAERLIVLPMDLVRYLTKDSGFLSIQSYESKRFSAFNPSHYFSPEAAWKAPYPYRSNDILFPLEKQGLEKQILQQPPQSLFAVDRHEQSLQEQLAVNDSLGG